MKKVLLLSITLLTVSYLSAQYWAQKSDFPGTERYAAVGLALNGKLYMGTGFNGVTMMNDWWEYDPSTHQWTQKTSFPGGARFGASTFVVNNKGYLFFGSTTFPNYNFPNDLWEYDPITDQWNQKASFPGQGRYTAVSMEINGKGYTGTGWRSGTFFNDWWEYDPQTNTWFQKANFTGGVRQSAVGFSLLNKGYLGLGEHGSNLKIDFWEYNPQANSWTQKNNFIGPGRSAAAYFNLNNFGYVGSGGTSQFGNIVLADYYKYNPLNDSWSIVNGFSPGRIVPVVASIGSCAYLVTGKLTGSVDPPSPQNTTTEFWEYCLLTDINDESNSIFNFTIYPNPIAESGLIKFYSYRNLNLTIEIVDIFGRKVSQLFNGFVTKDQKHIIEISKSDLKSGIYFIKFSEENTDPSLYKLIIY